jgi:hypothetical protein
MDREKAQLSHQRLQTFLDAGSTLVRALFLRKSAFGRASSTMKSASRASREKQDVEMATENLEVLQQRLSDMNAQIEQEIAAIQNQYEPGAVEITKASIHPRKSDITVGLVALLWTPWQTGAGGMAGPAF